ncbi:hypothetical protein PUNSTDRAFT_140325 [Punctularia strigosozonata HHB-11173 SS5]|uniref:uncharacterized protein n=1 Tax=Punctularia strigosozonata (strain HHB-11173) TaxID=741275 RepID=UPI0004416C6B|nr:uncharacterized protein PUNSTDRAFT_140325 [Punctularia strigosozonata HHB-11173 SS5]EIN13889.1 hypothetical protein PUNSTDRAFT_140325 [Punctularia strigosozonata HHB-11173 SS5]
MSLRHLLNPQQEFSSPSRTHTPLDGSQSDSPSSASDTELEEIAEDVQKAVISHEHKPHPDCPSSLSCLPDTSDRPQHTLPIILRCAIMGSPKQRLTIREIYAAMEDKYPYYRTAGTTWKQSVRHHLSLSRLFERTPRPPTEPGFGSHWTVNLAAPPGTKRPRKRGKRKSLPDTPPETITILPRIRGNLLPADEEHPYGSPLSPNMHSPPPHRPNKRLEDLPLSDEEHELESHLSCRRDRGRSTQPKSRDTPAKSGSQPKSFLNRPARSATTPPTRVQATDDNIAVDYHEYRQIERFDQDMEGRSPYARDSSSSAASRMADELARAQSEAYRALAELKRAYELLEDETRRRRVAERVAEEEARARKAAEEALRLLRA